MANPNAEATFRAKAPGIMAKLLSDFEIGVEDAAAILGNLGHESAGLTILQEINPTVAGSRGGFGWAQWTGPRRRAYEAYCKRNNLDPASDEANYAYLFIELKGIEGSEKAAIARTVAAKGIEDKVIAFEKAFLRAGVKHYPSRQQWARVALAAWNKAGQPRELPPAPDIPTYPETPPVSTPAAGQGFPAWVIILVLIGLAAAGLFFVRF